MRVLVRLLAIATLRCWPHLRCLEEEERKDRRGRKE